MKKDYHSPYSILSSDIICEHKIARIEQSESFTLHNHDGYELLLFLHGDVSVFVESEEKRLEHGNLIIIPPYVFHGMKIADINEYERIVLNIRPGILEEISDNDTNFADSLRINDRNKLNLLALKGSQLEELISLLTKLEGSLAKNSYGHTALSKAYLIEVLVAISQYTIHQSSHEYENAMSPTVKKIFMYIDTNLRNELSVEILAEALHHNSDYLGRVFKNATGSSLKYYINAKKIALAQQMLRQGTSPYDVCFMIGFNNYSSFSRCFSRHIGLSPKQYAMSLRKK